MKTVYVALECSHEDECAAKTWRPELSGHFCLLKTHFACFSIECVSKAFNGKSLSLQTCFCFISWKNWTSLWNFISVNRKSRILSTVVLYSVAGCIKNIRYSHFDCEICSCSLNRSISCGFSGPNVFQTLQILQKVSLHLVILQGDEE